MSRFSWWFIKEKRNEFYERAGLYLLYAFILSLASNPFIMLVVGLDKFNYVTVTSTTDPYYLQHLSPEQTKIVSSYKMVSQDYLDKQAEFSSRIEWVSIVGLLGWVCTSPGWERNFPKILKSLGIGDWF